MGRPKGSKNKPKDKSIDPKRIIEAVAPHIPERIIEHIKDAKYDPNENPKAISLIIQEDGNWIGEMYRYGRVVQVRDIGPETVLQKLLTHD